MVDNRWVIVLRLARAVVLALAGSVVTLAQLALPSKRFWDGQVGLQWASVLVVALFICYDAVRSVGQVLQAARIRSYDNDLRAALCAAISSVVLMTGAPWDEVTVAYYRCRGPFRCRGLIRVGAVKAGADAADVDVRVRSGTGVVGVAFATRQITRESWRHFVDAATAAGPVAWARRPDRDRYGLSWGQLRRSAQPEGVLASPTFAESGRPDGCLLLCGPLSLPELSGEDMRRLLDDLAAVIDRLGPPPTGWWGAHGR